MESFDYKYRPNRLVFYFLVLIRATVNYSSLGAETENEMNSGRCCQMAPS